MVIPKVRGPVSGVSLSCQPAVVLELAMMSPSSAGQRVGKTHASQVMLPLGVSATGLPRSTKLEVPLKVRASPYLPCVVHVAPVIVPVMQLLEVSAVVEPNP